MQTLKGRTCVFAGATNGDGRDTAKALCAAGMNVILMTHAPEYAQSLYEEIKAAGYPGDCAISSVIVGENNPDKDKNVYDEIEKKYGSIDVVICNTGGNGTADSIDTVSQEDLMKSINHLCGGSYKSLKTALPYLRRSKCPRVIFMTTIEGCSGGTYESFANAVAKGAVRSLTLNCARRLASEGIPVNCVSKGAIPRIEPQQPDAAHPELMLPEIPMGRLGTPVDLANVICFLASEECSYITGQIIELSGGMNLGR